MTSDKDQESYQQPNYADHLKRVRRVKRTLDVNYSPKQPPSEKIQLSSEKKQPSSENKQPSSENKQPSSEREHVSHESIRDQAISRKTRRPAEDYAIGTGLLGAETQAESPKSVQAQTPPAGFAEPSVPPQLKANKSEKPAENIVSAKPAEQIAANSPMESSSKGSVVSADKFKNPVVKNDFGDPGDGQPKKRGSTQFVAKTLLDHNAIIKAQALRHKARVEEQISKRQLEPVKIIEPIKAQKEVRSCPFSWTDDSSTERFKHCSKCQSTIYNLNGLDSSEVESLIFTRENIKKFVLYKRPDGKFMTSNCPVAQKRTQQVVAIVAVCICVLACIAAVLIMMPPPRLPSPTVDNSWGEPAPNAVSPESESTGSESKGSQTAGTKSSTTKSGGTVQHYEAGDILPAEPASGSKTTDQAPKPVNESEEKGDFWEFSGQ